MYTVLQSIICTMLSVMKIRKIRELQLMNVQTLVIQVHLGPNICMYT